MSTALLGSGQLPHLQQLENPHVTTLALSLTFSLFWPRYHYYGIAVKESSQYYDVMYSKKGAAWVSETGKKEVSKQTVAYSPRSKLGTLLPEFPNVKDLNLPASLPEEKVTTSEATANCGGVGGAGPLCPASHMQMLLLHSSPLNTIDI